jgi:hypothetical protein
MLTLSWVKSTTGDWLSLGGFDLAGIKTVGVYVIWFAAQGRNVVRLGQGKIADRLAAHGKDKEILAYAQYGALKVTWAAVPAAQLDAVERYLADTLNPLVGDAFPDVVPLAVNLPA